MGVILTDTVLADLDAIIETTLEEFGTLQPKRIPSKSRGRSGSLKKPGT